MFRRVLDLARDSLTYGVASLLEKLVGFLLIPLYSAQLSPKDYGVMGLFVILGSTFEAIAFLGMRSAMYREYSLADDDGTRRRAVSGALVTVLATSLLLGVAGSLASEPVARLFISDPEQAGLVWIALLGSALNMVQAVPILVYQSARRAKLVSALNIGRLICTVSLTIWFVVVADQGVRGVLTAQALSIGAFALLQSVLLLREHGFELDLPMIRRMIVYGLPLVPHRLLLVALGAFATYRVSTAMGLHETGLYAMAARFATPIGFVVEAINTAWWPYKFRVFKEEKDPGPHFRSLVSYYFVLTTYLWVGVSLWSPDVLRWMTPAEYHDAALLIPLLAMSRLAMGAANMLGTGMELGDDIKPVALSSGLALVGGVVSSYLFIPLWGAQGAALAACVPYWILAALMYRLAQQKYRIPYDWTALSGILGAGVAAVVAARFAGDLPTWPRLGALTALSLLYPLVVTGLLAASPSERDRLRRYATLAFRG